MLWRKPKKKPISKKNTDQPVNCLVVGLGNPGEKYTKTAHNCGFRVVSHLRDKEKFPHFEKDNTLNSLKTRGVIENKETTLLLPLTFMNRSGQAVKKAVERFRPTQLVIVHDDIDLSSGTLRFSVSRGSAGHKGVKSIISHLKSKDFMRLRVGIREKDQKAEKVVLKNLSLRLRKIEERAAEILKQKISSDDKEWTETIKIEK